MGTGGCVKKSREADQTEDKNEGWRIKDWAVCMCERARARVCVVRGVCVQPSVSNVSERGAFLMKHVSWSDNYTSRKQGHLQSMCET